ncbi:MAG: hypothetical protein LBQ50_07850 [Planctomycetaceae bacterium]|nr:hypothetical protein [Planctomycetaceae bacterium]
MEIYRKLRLSLHLPEYQKEWRDALLFLKTKHLLLMIGRAVTKYRNPKLTRIMKYAAFFFFTVLFFLSFSAVAEEPKKLDHLSDFMRVTKKEGRRQPVSFDTAIVRFADERKKIKVDLVAAVHIGDKEYYEELNKIFKRYDAVLYELVAEKGTKPDKTAVEEKKGKSLLSAFQSGMGESLELDFQLEHVDYKAKNMVHADLSPSEFAKRVADRGDLIQILYRAIVLGMKKGANGQDEEIKMQGRLLGTLLASNQSLALKRFFAKEMISQMDDSMWILGGEEGSAIITDRNAAALKILRKEIKNGKKKIAIFYGGAHLPEFAKSLEKDFNLKLTETTWVVAWDLTSDHSARP